MRLFFLPYVVFFGDISQIAQSITVRNWHHWKGEFIFSLIPRTVLSAPLSVFPNSVSFLKELITLISPGVSSVNSRLGWLHGSNPRSLLGVSSGQCAPG